MFATGTICAAASAKASPLQSFLSLLHLVSSSVDERRAQAAMERWREATADAETLQAQHEVLLAQRGSDFVGFFGWITRDHKFQNLNPNRRGFWATIGRSSCNSGAQHALRSVVELQR